VCVYVCVCVCVCVCERESDVLCSFYFVLSFCFSKKEAKINFFLKKCRS
jgi:hypothetical protein